MSPAGKANHRTVKPGPLEKKNIKNLIFLWKISYFEHLLFGEVKIHNAVPTFSDWYTQSTKYAFTILSMQADLSVPGNYRLIGPYDGRRLPAWSRFSLQLSWRCKLHHLPGKEVFQFQMFFISLQKFSSACSAAALWRWFSRGRMGWSSCLSGTT